MSPTATAEVARSSRYHPAAAEAVRPRRVLHVVNGEHYAGAERVQDLLGLRLGEFGYEVGFACLKTGEFARQRQCKSAPLHDLRMIGRFDLGPAWELAALIRAEGYELLHAHTPRSAMIAAVASLLTGVPMVYHVHSPVSRDTTHPLRNLLNSMVEGWAARRARALVAVSHSLGGYVRRRRGVARKVVVVPNGVPAPASHRGGREVRAEFTLGVVALFRPRKGLEVLLRALAEVRRQGHAVRLRAVGRFETPGYDARIKALAEELSVADAVDWVGFSDDVGAELRRMDLMVLPSLFGEGLPMVVLEAMAAGVPVVASRVEGIPEAIRDGIDGLLVPPNDARALTEAVKRIVRGEVDRDALGGLASRRHAELFSDVAMARGVAEVYRRVLENG